MSNSTSEISRRRSWVIQNLFRLINNRSEPCLPNISVARRTRLRHRTACRYTPGFALGSYENLGRVCRSTVRLPPHSSQTITHFFSDSVNIKTAQNMVCDAHDVSAVFTNETEKQMFPMIFIQQTLTVCQMILETSLIFTLFCPPLSRSRKVTVPSSRVSKSTVTQCGVPISSCLR